uniref:Uncharacterized protein n=1 Tax=Physcomitrium patens TaxID=3218 RepID=A0A7I3Z8F9_PHYPA
MIPWPYRDAARAAELRSPDRHGHCSIAAPSPHHRRTIAAPSRDTWSLLRSSSFIRSPMLSVKNSILAPTTSSSSSVSVTHARSDVSYVHLPPTITSMSSVHPLVYKFVGLRRHVLSTSDDFSG